MAYLTNYQYYYNEGNSPTDIYHGEYQYLSIKDIVNNFMLYYVGEDKVIDNVAAHEARFHAKQVVKRLNYDAFKSIRVLQETIDSNLRLIMPHDYVDYIRISLLVNGTMYPMTENYIPYISTSYTKDGNGDLTFDGNGKVIVTSGEINENSGSSSSTPEEDCCTYLVGSRYGLDTHLANSNPKFYVDRNRGYIDFPSTMEDKEIVIEYISDGMEGGDDDEIVIHKFFEQYIYRYMVHSILNVKFGTPKWRIDDASKAATAEYRNAKIRIMDLDPEKMLMPLRGQSKWIK